MELVLSFNIYSSIFVSLKACFFANFKKIFNASFYSTENHRQALVNFPTLSKLLFQ